MRPKSEIYTPKRDDKHPQPLHMHSPPPRHQSHDYCTVCQWYIMSGMIKCYKNLETNCFLALLRYVLLISQHQEIIAEGHAAAQIINQVSLPRLNYYLKKVYSLNKKITNVIIKLSFLACEQLTQSFLSAQIMPLVATNIYL